MKRKLSNYKIWVLILRALLLSIPRGFVVIGEKAELLCDWLNEALPKPLKNRYR